MRRHWAYGWYVLRHKVFVYLAARKLGLGFWQSFVHDWSKFLPDEWIAYAHTFYGSDGKSQPYRKTDRFFRAWLKHIHRNPHHWQHWLLMLDTGQMTTLEMPRHFIVEMVADWVGAGIAIKGEIEVRQWYETHHDSYQFHPNTRLLVEELIAIVETWRHDSA